MPSGCVSLHFLSLSHSLSLLSPLNDLYLHTAIWTMEPDTTTTIIIIVITIIIRRSKHSLKNKILHSCSHKLSCSDIVPAHTQAECVRCFSGPFVVEMRAGWSSVGGGLDKRGRRNCCFYKERNKQAALGKLSHTKPRRERLSVSLLGLNIGSTKTPNEKQTLR